MRTLLLALVLLSSLSSVASAQAHPRRARVMRLLGPASAAVLVAPDRAWVPDDGQEDPLSVCAGDRCAPVRAIERCEVPRCPGSGRLAILGAPIASVGGYPTDRDGFERERQALYGDPELAAIGGYFGYHPQPAPTPGPPARWRREDAEDVRWELSVGVGASYLAHTDVGTGALTLGGGPRFHVDWGTGDDDDFFNVLLGSSLGADLRVHVLPNLHGQTFDDYAVAVGVAPALGAEPLGEIVRLPTIYGVLVPEFGVIASGGRDAAFYAQWSASAAFLLDEHVATELRASFMLIDDWVEGDPVEGIFGISAALVLR